MTNKDKLNEAQLLINEVLESESKKHGVAAQLDFQQFGKLCQLHMEVSLMITIPSKVVL